MDINEAGIEGIKINFIQNLLKPRSFKVKVNEVLSDTKVQTEGMFQENLVSPKFFLLKIKEKVIAQLPNDNCFRYHFTLMISRCPTAIRIGGLLRESFRIA